MDLLDVLIQNRTDDQEQSSHLYLSMKKKIGHVVNDPDADEESSIACIVETTTYETETALVLPEDHCCRGMDVRSTESISEMFKKRFKLCNCARDSCMDARHVIEEQMKNFVRENDLPKEPEKYHYLLRDASTMLQPKDLEGPFEEPTKHAQFPRRESVRIQESFFEREPSVDNVTVDTWTTKPDDSGSNSTTSFERPVVHPTASQFSANEAEEAAKADMNEFRKRSISVKLFSSIQADVQAGTSVTDLLVMEDDSGSIEEVRKTRFCTPWKRRKKKQSMQSDDVYFSDDERTTKRVYYEPRTNTENMDALKKMLGTF